MNRRRLCGFPWGLFLLPVAAHADPLAGAAMTVFDGGQARQVALVEPSEFTMAVYSPDGERVVAVQPAAQPTLGSGHVKVSVGKRQDDVRWTIPASAWEIARGANPNILSELDYRDIRSTELRIASTWTGTNGLTLTGDIAYARASSGEVRDSDYFYDNRQGEWSRAYSSLDGSTAFDISVGAGWQFHPTPWLRLTPMGGLARHSQVLRMTDLRYVLWNQSLACQLGAWCGDIPLGPIPGHDSRFKPVWQGPWIGLRLTAEPIQRLSLEANLEYHRIHYEARANWNLRNDLAPPLSFSQEGDGEGWKLSASAEWQLPGGNALTADVGWRRFSVGDGIKTTYWSNGGHGKMVLNEVIAKSWAAHLGYRLEY